MQNTILIFKRFRSICDILVFSRKIKMPIFPAKRPTFSKFPSLNFRYPSLRIEFYSHSWLIIIYCQVHSFYIQVKMFKVLKAFDEPLKGNSGLSTSWAQMKEHEKSKRTSHHRPSCANWFLRYRSSNSYFLPIRTPPFSRF